MSGHLQIIIAILMWAISSFLVKLTHAPGVVILSLASLMGLAVLLIKLGAEKRLTQITGFSKPTMLLLIILGISQGLNNGLFFSAIKTTTMANAVLTHYLAPPILVMFFAPLILSERITRVSIAATLTGLAGLIFILWPGLQESKIEIGIVFGIGSAVLYAFQTTIERRLAVFGIDPEMGVVYKLAIPGLMMLPFAIFHISRFGTISGVEWVKIGVLGVILWLVSWILFFKGLKTVLASHAAILTYLEPAGAIFLAFLFLGERLTLLTVFGGILILSSGITVIMKGARS